MVDAGHFRHLVAVQYIGADVVVESGGKMSIDEFAETPKESF